MSNGFKRAAAIAAPLMLLIVSVSILLRYPDDDGTATIAGLGVGGVLVAVVVVSVVVAWRARRAAQRVAQTFVSQEPSACWMLVDVDRRGARAIRENLGEEGARVRPGLAVARIDIQQISLFRVDSPTHVVSLRPGAGIRSFRATITNRGNAYDEPCLRIVLRDGRSVDVILYEVSTGQWPSLSVVNEIPSSRLIESSE